MADDRSNQDEIEQLLAQANQLSGTGKPTRATAASPGNSGASTATIQQPERALADESAIAQSDVELLLNHAQEALASIDRDAELPAGIRPFEFAELGGTPASHEAATLELMGDVQLDLNIELGRTHMHLEDVLRMKRGSVVPLDKLAGDPVDVYVNGRKIARGEVLVMNDNFCVRVTELVVGDSACA